MMILMTLGDDDITPQERAARVAVEIALEGKITNKRVREITNLKSRGALRLLNIISRRVLPIIYDESSKAWYMIE